jgi:hypothetical protein
MYGFNWFPENIFKEGRKNLDTITMRKAIPGQSIYSNRVRSSKLLSHTLFVLGFVIVLLINGITGFGQSMDRVDTFLEATLAPFDQTIYIILATAELVSEDATTLQAIDQAQKLFPRFQLPGDLRSPISAQVASYVLMESFGISGGIMYQLFPGPWYAIREANHRGLFPGTRRAGQRLTPFDILYGVSRSAEIRDGRQ